MCKSLGATSNLQEMHDASRYINQDKPQLPSSEAVVLTSFSLQKQPANNIGFDSLLSSLQGHSQGSLTRSINRDPQWAHS